MKGNSYAQLSSRLYAGDLDGDKIDELIEVDGRHIHAFRCSYEHPRLLDHVFSSPVKRLIIGDFVISGREKGKDQILAVLEDGSVQGWAISDDLTVLWWWFTQASFIQDHENFVVGDFDGDGADEILVHDPVSGSLKFWGYNQSGFIQPKLGFTLGNLEGHDLRNKTILAGEFGQASGRKDILVVDRNAGRVTRFDSVTNSQGEKTFWWAFTSNASLFQPGDQLVVANINGSHHDGLIIRNMSNGTCKLLRLEFGGGNLISDTNANAGQLPVHAHAGRFLAARIREAEFRSEPGEKRDDVLFFNESTCEIIRTDARFDRAARLNTYWWAYSSNLVVEPIRIAEKRPFAVILCRFKGLPGDPAIEKYFREIFSPGSGGLIEYWHDVSLGAVDISGSRVLGWFELDFERKDAAIGRGRLIDAAVAAANRSGVDPVTGYYRQIAVFTHDWTKDGAPPGADWSTPGWEPFWIDGSADGAGRVSAPPHGQSGSFLAHEMGHSQWFDHDLGADLMSQYGDRNCIMSAMLVDSFVHPPWNVPFGPSMSFPQLDGKGWTYTRRVLSADPAWRNDPNGLQFNLAAISDPKINAPLGAIVPANVGGSKFWNYYLEYQRPISWNRGISPKLVIRRRVGTTAAFLGEIWVPNAQGGQASWREPSGNVLFQVERIRADDRLIRVTVSK